MKANKEEQVICEGNFIEWHGEMAFSTSTSGLTKDAIKARLQRKYPKQMWEEMSLIKLSIPLRSGEVRLIRWYLAGMTSDFWFKVSSDDLKTIINHHTGTEILENLRHRYPEYMKKESERLPKKAKRLKARPTKRIRTSDIVKKAKQFLAEGGKCSRRAIAEACGCSSTAVHNHWKEITS